MSEPTDSTGSALEALEALVTHLRGPDGCPWDREQSARDIRAYLLEEAHEVAAAIDSASPAELQDELGDLLFQIVFLSDLARAAGDFELRDVIRGIHDKMIERHPHVFGSQRLESAEEVSRVWERRKIAKTGRSVLDGVPRSLPALVGSYRIGQKAAGIDFDWRSTTEVWTKVEEEIAELQTALRKGSDAQELEHELGDVLFTLANLGRHLQIDPERALAEANLRFRRRFREVEGEASKIGADATGDERRDQLEEAWRRAKNREAP